MVKIHILGICGTFMGSLAVLAAKAGMQVSGQDSKFYHPMSTQLQAYDIALAEGYAIEDLPKDVDMFVIGNVMRRGMPIIEHILNKQLPFMSGPEFLAKHIMRDQHVLVVTGTHGKTTTTSILTWILHYAGLNPGYLIGGVPNNFGVSADLGGGKYFVVEGDEYDCAFFDKRSKFLHYKANTLIINNLEFDHSDIFKDLDAIITQFHYLLRAMPGSSLIVYNAGDINIRHLLDKGCWSKTVEFGNNELPIVLPASLLGKHNYLNALAAVAAAQNVGISLDVALDALRAFTGVKRRLELKGKVGDVSVYSDFAHHPTAIATTLAAMRDLIGPQRRIHVIVDISSNTMRAGIHKDTLAPSVAQADSVYFFHGADDITWDVHAAWRSTNKSGGAFNTQAAILTALLENLKDDDLVLLMSNGAFESFALEILGSLAKATAKAID